MTNGCNLDVQVAIFKSGFRQYEIAQKVGVTPSYLCTWMRTEMPEEKKQRIFAAIEELKKERG